MDAQNQEYVIYSYQLERQIDVEDQKKTSQIARSAKYHALQQEKVIHHLLYNYAAFCIESATKTSG